MGIRSAVRFCIIAAALYIQPEVEGAQTGEDPGSGSADISSAVEVPQGVLFGEFSEEDGPLLLKGSVIVPSGEQLVLNPGVKVYIGGEYSTITVFEQMIVQGSERRPVVFQSAKDDPEKWDWDRIYIRSRKLSILNHCIVKHSNYGLYIENSRVNIKGMAFEKNSIHGMVVRNSKVNMRNTVFKGGHVGALFCSAGADVSADSCSFTYNNTGVICAPRTTV
ncbi:MAG: right-handed parallel beta-helix repeat-containing protein, partial [Chitinivibrionales bacterium]